MQELDQIISNNCSTDLAVQFTWRSLVLSSDALLAVKAINNLAEPGGWDTRYTVLKCRSILISKGWTLIWNARSSNKLADAAARKTLVTKIPLLFDNADVLGFPDCILSLILADCDQVV